MARSRESTMNSNGTELVLPYFDPYISSFMTPEHLLSSLIKNSLHLCTIFIDSASNRERFQLTLSRCVLNAELPTQS